MYTKDDKELNPRVKQVERPRTAGELILTLAVECHKYLSNKGENDETYCHIFSSLLPNPRHAQKYDEVKNPEHLQRQIKYILSEYKARNRKNPYVEAEVEGALDFTKREFARRMLNPYLDNLILKNGDIFPKQMEYSDLYEDVTNNNAAIEGIDAELREMKLKISELSLKLKESLKSEKF